MVDVHGECDVCLFVVPSCVLYSAGSGVKRVHVVLSGLRMKWFVHVSIAAFGVVCDVFDNGVWVVCLV